MENTVSSTVYQHFRQEEAHDDFDLYFDYSLIYSGAASADTDKRLQVHFRKDATSGEMVYLDIRPDKFQLNKYISSVYSTIVQDTNAGSVSSTDYSVWVHARGDRIEVWRGEVGEPMQLLVETDSSPRTDGDKFRFNAAPDADVSVDNIVMSDALAGQSFSDDFTDSNYTADPAWTVDAGTWSVNSGVLKNTYNISTDSTIGRDLVGDSVTANFSYSYYDTSVSWYGVELYYNDTGTANLDAKVEFDLDKIYIKSYDGSTWTTAMTKDIGITQDDWYDTQVVKDGDHIEVWWGEQGATLTKAVSADLDGYYGADEIQFVVPAYCPSRKLVLPTFQRLTAFVQFGI